jgi:hypothetical protein
MLPRPGLRPGLGNKKGIRMTEILNIRDAVTIAAIIETTSHQRVARLMDNGDLIVGTGRSIGDERGGFLRSDEDVRDGFLRVTTDQGWEAFWLVRDLIPLHQSGHFVAPYSS